MPQCKTLQPYGLGCVVEFTPAELGLKAINFKTATRTDGNIIEVSGLASFRFTFIGTQVAPTVSSVANIEVSLYAMDGTTLLLDKAVVGALSLGGAGITTSIVSLFTAPGIAAVAAALPSTGTFASLVAVPLHTASLMKVHVNVTTALTGTSSVVDVWLHGAK